MVEEWVVLAGALAAGFAVGALTVLLLSLRRQRPAPEPTTEVIPHGPRPAEPGAPPSAPAAGPAGHLGAPQRVPLSPHDATVPLEWAERAHPGAGPVPGRARGVCSGCGTAINVSMRRPVRVACPECGNTRLLS